MHAHWALFCNLNRPLKYEVALSWCPWWTSFPIRFLSFTKICVIISSSNKYPPWVLIFKYLIRQFSLTSEWFPIHSDVKLNCRIKYLNIKTHGGYLFDDEMMTQILVKKRKRIGKEVHHGHQERALRFLMTKSLFPPCPEII